MNVSIRTQESTATIDLLGNMTAEADCSQLHQTVSSLLEIGTKEIVLNMKRVSFLDCSGMGDLVRCYHRTSRKGCSLRLENLSQCQQQILDHSGLLDVFHLAQEHAVERLQLVGERLCQSA